MATAVGPSRVLAQAQVSPASTSTTSSDAAMNTKEESEKSQPSSPITPSSSGGHCRDRSHFTIPDVMVTACDEEGQSTHFEVQLEEAKRRTPLSSLDRNRITPAADRGAQKHAQPRKGGENAKSSNAEKGAIMSLKNLTRRRRATSTKTADSIVPFTAKDVFHLPVDNDKDPMSPTNFSVFSFESGSSGSNHDDPQQSQLARRLRKSSLPSLFTRKERDAAAAAAIKDLPAPASSQKSLARKEKNAGHAGMRAPVAPRWAKNNDPLAGSHADRHGIRKSAEAESVVEEVDIAVLAKGDKEPSKTARALQVEESAGKEKMEKRKSRSLSRRLSLPNITKPKVNKAPSSEAPATPADAAKLPQNKQSKKVRKAKEREEAELLREWKQLDKLVREHDAKMEERKSCEIRRPSAEMQATFPSAATASAKDDDEVQSQSHEARPIEARRPARSSISRSSSQVAELSCLPLRIEAVDFLDDCGEAGASGQSTPRPMPISKDHNAPRDKRSSKYNCPQSAPPTSLAFDSLYRNIEDMEDSFVRKYADEGKEQGQGSSARFSLESDTSAESLKRSRSVGTATTSVTAARRSMKPSGPLPALPRQAPTSASIDCILPTMGSEVSFEELARSLMASGVDSWPDFGSKSKSDLHRHDTASTESAGTTLNDACEAAGAKTLPQRYSAKVPAGTDLLTSVDSSAGSSGCSMPVTPPQQKPTAAPQKALSDLRLPPRGIQAALPLRDGVPQLIITQSGASKYSTSLDQLDEALTTSSPREALPTSPTRMSSAIGKVAPASPTSAKSLPAATAALLAGRRPVRVGANPSGFSFPPRKASC